MKNQLGDLNDHLFAQLERLTKEDLPAEQVAEEVKRSEAVVALADQIIGVGKLRMDAAKLFALYGDKMLPHLPLIGKSEQPK